MTVADFHTTTFKYQCKFSLSLLQSLREQTSILGKFLNINEFKQPEIHKLASRYITDLNLPDDVAIYVERLINLLPPKMKTRGISNYPAYEARAMAYIIFVLKLLFGLDGHKEILISNAARLINTKIKHVNDPVEHHQKQLFIWSDWMEYIEMRKVIIAQFSQNFGRDFDQYQDPEKLLVELSEEFQRLQEDDVAQTGNKEQIKPRIESMKRMFEQLHQNYSNTQSEKETASISFSPSFTPAHSYYKRILLHVSNADKSIITIPEFMRVDHTQLSIKDFLQPKMLNAFFQKQGEYIKIQKVACTKNRTFVGIFRTPPEGKVKEGALEADFGISDKDWLEQIKEEPQIEELEFKTNFDSYHIKHLQRLRRKMGTSRNMIEFNKLRNNSKNMNKVSTYTYDLNKAEISNN